MLPGRLGSAAPRIARLSVRERAESVEVGIGSTIGSVCEGRAASWARMFAVTSDDQPADIGSDDWSLTLSTLKSRLAADPRDGAARRGLVQMYRASRHLDQAGRYGIAVDGLATRRELSAYGAMLRGLRATDDRMRILSRLPDGTEISSTAREALDESPTSEGFLAATLPVAWLIVAASIVVMLVGTFIGALTNPADVNSFAVTCSIITLGAIALAAFVTASWAATQKFWRSTAVWSAIGTTAIIAGMLLLPG